jgi:kumamolisin
LTQINRAFRAAAARGITICCASGDDGSSDDGGRRAHVDFPASSPFVLACGGTRIKASHGVIVKETVWNDKYGAGGGGISAVFDPPDWQSGVNLPPSAHVGGRKGRGLPDVAGLADSDTGFIVINVKGSELEIIGGTSATAPLWAALIARINEGLGVRVGYLNPLLYQRLSGVLRDITEGNIGAYAAAAGWDAYTGFGSPDGAALLHALRTGHAAKASS